MLTRWGWRASSFVGPVSRLYVQLALWRVLGIRSTGIVAVIVLHVSIVEARSARVCAYHDALA